MVEYGNYLIYNYLICNDFIAYYYLIYNDFRVLKNFIL